MDELDSFLGLDYAEEGSVDTFGVFENFGATLHNRFDEELMPLESPPKEESSESAPFKLPYDEEAISKSGAGVNDDADAYDESQFNIPTAIELQNIRPRSTPSQYLKEVLDFPVPQVRGNCKFEEELLTDNERQPTTRRVSEPFEPQVPELAQKREELDRISNVLDQLSSHSSAIHAILLGMLTLESLYVHIGTNSNSTTYLPAIEFNRGQNGYHALYMVIEPDQVLSEHLRSANGPVYGLITLVPQSIFLPPVTTDAAVVFTMNQYGMLSGKISIIQLCELCVTSSMQIATDENVSAMQSLLRHELYVAGGLETEELLTEYPQDSSDGDDDNDDNDDHDDESDNPRPSKRPRTLLQDQDQDFEFPVFPEFDYDLPMRITADVGASGAQRKPPINMTSSHVGALRRASTLVLSRLSQLAMKGIVNVVVANRRPDTLKQFWEFAYAIYDQNLETRGGYLPWNVFDKFLDELPAPKLSLRLHQVMFAAMSESNAFLDYARTICAFSGVPLASGTHLHWKAVNTVFSELATKCTAVADTLFDDQFNPDSKFHSFQPDSKLYKLSNKLLRRPLKEFEDDCGEDQAPFFRAHPGDAHPQNVEYSLSNDGIDDSSKSAYTLRTVLTFAPGENNYLALQRLALSYLMLATYAEDFFTKKAFIHKVKQRFEFGKRGVDEDFQEYWPASFKADYDENIRNKIHQKGVVVSDMLSYRSVIGGVDVEFKTSTRNPYKKPDKSSRMTDNGHYYGSPIMPSPTIMVDARAHMRMHWLHEEASPCMESLLLPKRVDPFSKTSDTERRITSVTIKHKEYVNYVKEFVKKLKGKVNKFNPQWKKHKLLLLYGLTEYNMGKTYTTPTFFYQTTENDKQRNKPKLVPNKYGQHRSQKKFEKNFNLILSATNNDELDGLFDLTLRNKIKTGTAKNFLPANLSTPKKEPSIKFPFALPESTRWKDDIKSKIKIDANARAMFTGSTDYFSMFLESTAEQTRTLKIEILLAPWFTSFRRSYQCSSISILPIVQHYVTKLDSRDNAAALEKLENSAVMLADTCIGLVTPHALCNMSIMAADSLCFVFSLLSMSPGIQDSNVAYALRQRIYELVLKRKQLLQMGDGDARLLESRNFSNYKYKTLKGKLSNIEDCMLPVRPYLYKDKFFGDVLRNNMGSLEFNSFGQALEKHRTVDGQSPEYSHHYLTTEHQIFGDMHACKLHLLNTANSLMPAQDRAIETQYYHIDTKEDALYHLAHPFWDA